MIKLEINPEPCIVIPNNPGYCVVLTLRRTRLWGEGAGVDASPYEAVFHNCEKRIYSETLQFSVAVHSSLPDILMWQLFVRRRRHSLWLYHQLQSVIPVHVLIYLGSIPGSVDRRYHRRHSEAEGKWEPAGSILIAWDDLDSGVKWKRSNKRGWSKRRIPLLHDNFLKSINSFAPICESYFYFLLIEPPTSRYSNWPIR